MRSIIITLLGILLFPVAAGTGGYQTPAAAHASKVEIIDAIEIVEPQPDEKSSRAGGWTKIRHRLLKISGPVIWLAMATAIVTRHVRIKGKARQLSVIHKICGYTAFGVGTLHGLYGLFL